MFKKMLLILTIFLFISTASAAITDYTVPGTIPLNNVLTIYGVNDAADVVCSFFLIDTADQNQVIIRLSDEYSNASGRFYAEFHITEPLFRRGFDYNALTVCGTNEVSQLFYVEQKEDLALGITMDSLRMDFAWWLDPENSLTAVFFLFVLLLISVFCYGIYQDLKG